MASGRRPRADRSQPNTGPSQAANIGGNATDSHDPTCSSGPVNAQERTRPVNNIASAVVDMVDRACALHGENAEAADLHCLAKTNKLAFRVATMCSGTEAPIFFIKMLMETFVTTGSHEELFRFRHVFSVEKEPFKQAYIMRNTDSIVFRDVLDFAGSRENARTAKGSVAPIPENIDILIAGTTCVDFSNLNNKKQKSFSPTIDEIVEQFQKNPPRTAAERLRKMSKALNEIKPTLGTLGSSEQTFFSMLLYVKDHRPRIVILENVRGAPFTTAQDLWFHWLNYAASQVVLDTKECYFPQTRERKYLIAVSRDNFKEADEGVRHFQEIIQKLKRRHSSSVEDFLLADNDTRAQLARLESEDTARNKNTRETAWDYSHLRHEEARRDGGLGRSRPLTGWKDDGTNNFYDRMDKIIMKTHPPRVLDSVDISHLKSRSLASPYDIRYKTKVLDLSQNVDRQHIAGGFGIVPCITPNAMSWITNQWRFVTGLEALILQGLPIDRLSLSRETQTNLLDLAGNAMTTTAVGMVFTAAMLCLGGRKVDSGQSLVRTFHGNKEFESMEMPFASTVGVLTPVGRTDTAPEPAYDTTDWTTNMGEIRAVYVQARRYCCCNGSTKYSVKKTKRCQACSVVRCTNCAGNPIHQFEAAVDFNFQPMTFQNAERELTRLFPTVIPSLFQDCHTVDERLLQSPLGVIVDELWKAEFFYQRTYVTEVVTVQYASNAGFVLHAVIQDEGITWYLFLDRHSNLGRRTVKPETWLKAHCVRKKPFARCFLQWAGSSLRPACRQWEFWICPQIQDKKAKFQVFKQSIGGRNRITLQYTNDQNLEQADNDSLQRLAGNYDHHPECESAEDSLHIRKGTNESSQLYLFKDPTRSGPLGADTFVISRENRQLQLHEHREALVEFAPSVQLHKAGLGISPPAEVVLKGRWELMREWLPLSPLSPRTPVLGNEQLVTPTYHRDGLRSCQSGDRLIFKLKLTCPRHEGSNNLAMDPQFLLRKLEWVSQGGWAAVPVHQMRSFFETFSFATSKAITHIKASEFVDISSCRTEDCSVRLPQVKWYIPEPKALPEPLHLTGDIARYEAALKKEAPVFQAQFKVSVVSDEQMKVRLRFVGNHARLAHRAEAVMPPERRTILTEPSDITLSAGTQTRQNAPLVFPLQPFQGSIRPLEASNGGAVCNAAFPGTNHRLKPEQVPSVQWMLEHERNPEEFTERESEEEVIEGLQLRLIGLAERRVTRRGGLVADDIGFGKTVMSLALIDLQRGFDTHRFKDRKRQQSYDRRKALDCSLVIAPSHIVEQWGTEAHKFLKYELDKDVVLVQKLPDLRGRQIDKLMQARLIIVSDAIFASPGYQEPLSFWSGCNYPAATKTGPQLDKWLAARSYAAWHDDCVACVGRFLGDFLKDDSKHSRTRCMGLVNTHHHEREKANERLVKHVASNEVEMIVGEENGEARPRAPPQNTRNKDKMFYEEQFIFEFFSFNRVIWDEVGYNNPAVKQFVASVSAVSKWLLSGTPASQNLADVCSYANALGIHLARPIDLREGLPSAAQGPSLGTKTPCETIASYGRLKSDEFVKERHSQGQLFLEKFSSANMVDRDKFRTEYKVVISSPTLADRAVYQSLQHDIRRAEMKAKFLSGDGIQQIFAALGEKMSKTAGRNLTVETLIHAATVPSFAKKSWLSASKRLDDEEGTGIDEAPKRSFVQAIRKIQARRLFDAKIYMAKLFEKLVWLTYRFYDSSRITGGEFGDKARSKAKGFLRMIQFLKGGNLDEFGGEDNYVLVVRALFPELPYTSKEILCQAGSKDGLCLETLKDRNIVKFASLPNLVDPVFDLLYATRKTSWCQYYKVRIDSIDEQPTEDLFSLILDYERELQLLQQGSLQQGFEEMTKGDAMAHLRDVITNLGQANGEELRKRIRQIAKHLRNKREEIWTSRKNAYVADAAHPSLDPMHKETKRDELAQELRKNGVGFSSGATKPQLIARLTEHIEGRLSVKDYKSPNHESFQPTGHMPDLTKIMEIRGSKVLEAQEEFLSHYNMFITGLKHLYARGSELRRAQFFDRLSRPEGYNFACDECGSSDSLHLVHDCGHLLCLNHVRNKASCGEGSTLCTAPLGNFAVPIHHLAVLSRRGNPLKGLEELSDDVEMTGTDEVIDTKMTGTDEIHGIDGDDDGSLDCKIRTVIELIQSRVPQDDKVVVFTQYNQILKVVVKQLKAHGISCDTTTDSDEASKVLESFKKGKFKVLVMKQNSSEAAGGNLVVANHVIFVSPLVESSQHQYDTHMRQATGRCIREGQDKKVYVYHCVTEGTIEANILELREGKEIVVGPGDTIGELAESPHVGVPGGLRSTLSRPEVWRVMGEQDYNSTIGMRDGQVEFST